MPTYSIEARAYRVPELSVQHDYWLLRDLSSGAPIAELHGLITDRRSGAALQFGVDDAQTGVGTHALQAWHFIHAPVEGLWMAPGRTEFNDSALYWEGQKAVSVFVGDAAQALTRWNSAAAVLPALNARDLDYPARGVDAAAADAPDAHGIYATLGEVMGVELHAFEDGRDPMQARRLLDPRQIEAFRFRPGGRDDGVVADDAGLQDAAIAIDTAAPRAVFDPTDAAHPDHALYRQSLAAVHALDASLGRTPDDASRRLAASLLLVARRGGLDRIDHVLLSVRTDYVQQGQNVFVVQNDVRSWSHRRAHTDTQSAVTTPVEDSFRRLAALG